MCRVAFTAFKQDMFSAFKPSPGNQHCHPDFCCSSAKPPPSGTQWSCPPLSQQDPQTKGLDIAFTGLASQKLYVLCWSLSRVQLSAALWTVAHQAPLSMEFSRQEHWSGLPFPSPGDFPDSGSESGSPAAEADSLPSGPPGKPSFAKADPTLTPGPPEREFLRAKAGII